MNADNFYHRLQIIQRQIDGAMFIILRERRYNAEQQRALLITLQEELDSLRKAVDDAERTAEH